MINIDLVTKAYRAAKGCPFDFNLDSNSMAWITKFTQEYQSLEVLDQLQTSPDAVSPFRKAKEIALNAALAITPPFFDSPRIGNYDAKILTDRAESIYQWLTEPETDKR
jgi:hypothetical protein